VDVPYKNPHLAVVAHLVEVTSDDFLDTIFVWLVFVLVEIVLMVVVVVVVDRIVVDNLVNLYE
jgi:hypothetical protein